MRRATHEKILADRERAFQRERDQWLRERQDLLDRIMYMAERPWSPPPAELRPAPSAEELSPEVSWPVVLPEEHEPDELLDLIASQNGTE